MNGVKDQYYRMSVADGKYIFAPESIDPAETRYHDDCQRILKEFLGRGHISR